MRVRVVTNPMNRVERGQPIEVLTSSGQKFNFNVEEARALAYAIHVAANQLENIQHDRLRGKS